MGNKCGLAHLTFLELFIQKKRLYKYHSLNYKLVYFFKNLSKFCVQFFLQDLDLYFPVFCQSLKISVFRK